MLSKRSLILAAAAGLLAARSPPEPPPAAIGGPFKLVDQNGRPVDQSILNGKWTAIYFGFTYCPDACPTTLQALAEARKKLGRRAEDLQVALISVDPERDTPAQMKLYLDNQAFPPGTIGLTGTPEQVAHAAKSFKVYYKKVGEGADYTVDHASIVYLMDPKGRFVQVIGHGTSPDDMARIIGQAMA